MARVQGIISAGLASASNPRERNREITDKAERDAAAVRERVQERVGRAQATDQDGRTGDTFKSLLGGLGAATVFGGPAGLLVAGVAKLLQNKRRDGIAAYRQQAAEDSEAFISRSEEQISSFASHATTDEEKAEAEMLQGQWDQLRPLMNHPDPEVSSAAILRGQELTGTFDETFNDWEDERIAAETRDREQLEREINRAEGIRDDGQKEGGAFLIRQDAYERALAVDDTAAGDQVLLVNSFKMVDPNSAVLPGEAATAANTAGIPDILVTAYNRSVRDGERLDPDQRADILRQMGIQYQVARADQVDRNTAAIERGRDFGIRDNVLQHVTVPVKSPDELPFPTGQLVDDTARRSLAGQIEPTSVDPGTRPERQFIEPDAGAEFGRGAEAVKDETFDLFSDISVGVRGGKKFIGEDGQTYAEFPDGSVERARPDTETLPSAMEAWEANAAAKKRADDIAHNARIRRQRQASGADPETGIFPIQRQVNE